MAGAELSAPSAPTLLNPAGKALRVNLVQTQPFAATFGKKQTRKRPKLAVDSYAELLQQAEEVEDR